MKNKLIDEGYCVAKNIFTVDEILEIQKIFDIVEKKSIDKKQATIKTPNDFKGINRTDNQVLILGDLLAFNEFEKFNFILFHPKVLKLVRELIGSDFCYFGESNMQSGTGDRGFHSDNRLNDRENSGGEDWVGDYPLIRLALYLNDTDRYSGGVKIVPKSHKIPTSRFKKGYKNISSRMGDIVIWKFTTTHSGNALRLKLFNGISLHPRLEELVPKFLEKNNPHKRRGIFMTFGPKCDHLTRYVDYLKNRKDYRKYFQYSGTSKKIEQLALKSGVNLIRPIEDYGIALKPDGFNT